MATDGDHYSVYVDEDSAVGGRMPSICGPCGRKKKTTRASVLCSTCNTHLCRECCHIHRIHVPEHALSSIQDNKEGHVLIDMHGLDRCKEHDRVFVYVCQDHDALVCDKCLFYQHRRCDDIHKLTEMTQIEDVYLRGPVTKLRNKMSSGNDLADKCDMQLQGIEGRRDEIVLQLNQQKTELIRRFDEAKARIVEELDSHDTSDISRLQGVKQEVGTMQTNLQELVTLHKIVGKNGTDAEKFIINFACKKTDVQVTNKLDELRKNNYTASFKLIWDERIQNFMNSDDIFAHLQVTPPTLVVESSAFSDECGNDLNVDDGTRSSDKSPNSDNSSVEFQSPQQSLSLADVSRSVTLVFEAKSDLGPSDGDDDLPFVTGLAFLHDGRIAALDFRNRACFIMNTGLRRKGSSFRFKDKPMDVTCCMESSLAVTLMYVNEIFVFKIYILCCC